MTVNQPTRDRAVNRQVATNEGNIEVRVRVESKRQVLSVFGTLILLSQVKFIFILSRSRFCRTFGSPAANTFKGETGNLSIIDRGCLHSGINGHKDSWLNNSTYFPGK
ncbi:hypothetical protein QUB70_12475 [Microcoleus sp. A003_D6]|uniref:hypothetical protein n=1 Tax=Microcoleus sp. A003_D6 TaxID=3055266 RepID=UPI002FD430C4